VITDKRLMWDRGIIAQKLGMMPLTKVTDLTFQRTLGGRILGYGTVIVESAGQNQAFERVNYMPRPDEVYEALSELVFGDKGPDQGNGLLARPWWRR
jgi:Bacterial PH domain